MRIRPIRSIQDNATLLIGQHSLPVFPTQVIPMFQLSYTIYNFLVLGQKLAIKQQDSSSNQVFFQNNKALSNV